MSSPNSAVSRPSSTSWPGCSARAGRLSLSLGLLGVGAALEKSLDVGGVGAAVSPQADPNRAQVAGLLPTPDGRDVDTEHPGNLANAVEPFGVLYQPAATLQN